MTTVRLEADGLSTLLLGSEYGYTIRKLDLGAPDVRTVAQDAPDADGILDSTKYIGARTIGLQLRLTARGASTIAVRTNRLKAFTSPKLRPIFYVQEDGMPEQQAVVRGLPMSAPIDNPIFRDLTVQFVAAKGVLEASDPDDYTINAAGASGGGGLNLPFHFPLDFGASVPIGSASVTNTGTADAYPIIRIYGPCTDPTIRNLTQGLRLAFTGLTIGAGEFLEIDTRTKTILYQGLLSDSRYNNLSFATSDWWTLSPGVNELTFTPATYTAPSNAFLEWRSAWI